MSTIRQLFNKPHPVYLIPYIVSVMLLMPVVAIADARLGSMAPMVYVMLMVVFFVGVLWIQEVYLPRLKAKWGKAEQDEIASAEQRLESLLNYGGIHLDETQMPTRLTLQYQDGDLVDEVAQMRRIGNAFLELADRVEAQATRRPATKVPKTHR